MSQEGRGHDGHLASRGQQAACSSGDSSSPTPTPPRLSWLQVAEGPGWGLWVSETWHMTVPSPWWAVSPQPPSSRSHEGVATSQGWKLWPLRTAAARSLGCELATAGSQGAGWRNPSHEGVLT